MKGKNATSLNFKGYNIFNLSPEDLSDLLKF